MSKKLVIVESPAKAKTIGQYLGSDYVVKSSYGHVRDLPASVLGIDIEKDFEVSYKTIPRAKKVVAELKKSLQTASELLLATDPDREGEAIAWHLKQELKPKVPVKRISFTEITKSAVERAASHPREIDDNLVDAQQARRILDRLVGYKLSPLLWKKVYRGLSAGRVQSVAVRLVVEREREIQKFASRQYWTIAVTVKTKDGTFTADLIEKGSTAPKEFKDIKEAEKVLKKLEKSKFSIDEIEVDESTVKPKAPLITSTLQQASANNLGYSAKRTMKLAQDLYEGVDLPDGSTHGLITYMRTDSFEMSSEAKRDGEKHVSSAFGAKYLPQTPNIYSKKVKGAQEAHEAIRPTDFTRTPESLSKTLSKDHLKLYTLIYNTALASLMSPSTIETTVVNGTVDGFNLIARGRKVVFDGYMKALPNLEDRYVPLPAVKKGETLPVSAASSAEHITEPPARYSEASLVKELEKKGIGRPSTYAPIMSTIVDRGYVVKQAGRFTPEQVAFVVTDLLTEHFPNIVDYNFTAQMEDDLDDIAEGDKKLVPVLKAFYTPFALQLKDKMDSIDKKAIVEEATDKTCPNCQKPVVIKLGRFGQFYACSDYPTCDYTAPILKDEGVEGMSEKVEAELANPCPDCKSKLELKQSRFGSFIGCSNYPKCKFTKSISIEAEAPCPNCGQALLRKNTRRGKVFWGCSGYPKCKTAFWDEPSKKKCPNCTNLLLKKKTGLKCSQCDYEEDGSPTEKDQKD